MDFQKMSVDELKQWKSKIEDALVQKKETSKEKFFPPDKMEPLVKKLKECKRLCDKNEHITRQVSILVSAIAYLDVNYSSGEAALKIYDCCYEDEDIKKEFLCNYVNLKIDFDKLNKLALSIKNTLEKLSIELNESKHTILYEAKSMR